MNKQLKFGVVSGLVLGVAIFFIFAIQLSDPEAGLLFGLLVGGITVFVFGVTPMFLTHQTEKLAENDSIAKKVNQPHSLLINGSAEKVGQSLSHSARLLTKASIVRLEENLVVIKTGTNFKTFGEQVIVRVESLNARQTKLTITSSPLNKSTIVDFGKNDENVRVIIDYFKTEFSEVIKIKEINIDYSKKPIFIFNEEARLNRDYASLRIVRSDNEDVYLKFITPLREIGEQLLMVVGEKRFGFKVADHPLDEELIKNKDGGFDLLIKTILCPVRTGEANTYCFDSKQEQDYVLESVKDAVAYKLRTKVIKGERKVVKSNYGRFPREIEKSIQAGKYLCKNIKGMSFSIDSCTRRF